MVYSSGEFPRKYLDHNFFTQETKRCGLTPEMSKQFELIVQGLVSEFQHDVEATSEGFATFLQQTSDSPKDVMKALNKAQGDIQNSTDQFLDQMKGLLTEHAPDHLDAIEQFVKDVQAQIAPQTDLEKRVRANPQLAQKLPARSIFDLSSTASKPQVKRASAAPSSFQQWNEAITEWENSFPKNSGPYKLAEVIRAVIGNLKNQSPPATLQEVIQAIKQQVFQKSGPQDVYMQFEITPDQLQSLSKIFSEGKTNLELYPPFTKMDQKFFDAKAWMDDPKTTSQDKSLAESLVEEIKMLGSDNSNLPRLQAWAANTAATPDSAYSKASYQGEAQFASLTGIPQVTPASAQGAQQKNAQPGPSEGSFSDFIKEMQREQMMRMATEFSIENLISMVAQQAKVSVMPPFIQQIANKMIDSNHINIGGHPPYSPNQTIPPGEPLPTNSWWTLLADSRGAGILGLNVVPDNQPIQDPKSQIHLTDAKMFDPNAAVNGTVSIPYNVGYSPNVNQGVYNVQTFDAGFAFNPSEQFQSGPSDYSQINPYFIVAGAKENLLFPPTVEAHDDHSVTLVYKTKTGGAMSVPIVRGSPYQTFQYSGVTPYFNSTATPIDMDKVHAYFYKQVVATVTDPNTQISVQQAKALGLNSTVGQVDLVENTDGPPWKNGIKGQVFSYSTVSSGVVPGDNYRLYFSSPVTLNACNYITETVIPDSVPIPQPNPNHYIHDSTKTPYSTTQLDQFEDSGIATGLQASSPFSGTARTVKVPHSASSGKGGSSLIDAALQEINALMAQGKGMSDLSLWAAGMLSNTNFLQNFSQISAEDFYEFCRLTGINQMDAESRLAQTWLNRVPMQPGGQPVPQYKNWYTVALQLNKLTEGGATPVQIQQWLQNMIAGKDPTYSPIYKELDPISQEFVKVFSQFGLSPYQPETSLTQAFQDAQNVHAKTGQDLYQQTTELFDQDAWDIPISGHYESTGLGKWQYRYTTDKSVNPYGTLGFKNPPPAGSGKILIGLLKTDFTYLDGMKVFSDKIYSETMKGEVEFVETSNDTINFFDKDAKITWPDDDLSKLASKDQIDLATQYIDQVVPNLFLPDRHSNQVTYAMGKNVQNAADVAHALWKLAQLNPAVESLPGFQQALNEAKSVAEAGLDDYLTGGLLEYDKNNGMIISKFGQTGKYVDYSNADGEDHHFAYGYLIRAAAELRQVDPSWFQDPKWGSQRIQMTNLMINDVFNVQNNPNFPRMRMWDPYVGVGRATGLVPPAGAGMNEESTAEDYNCIQGIAMWAQVDGNSDLANQAATMAERVKNAAQAYWQPNSSTSIYTDAYAPEAAREFAKKVISCGVNWDTTATGGNYFTPAKGDPNIFTIAIEYITGNANLVDYDAAKAAFDYLINQKDSSGFARIFQNNIPINTPGASGYFSYISILIPLIAQVSPNAATALLNWFQKANSLQPNVYSYDTGCNYGTIYQQILMAKANATHADPFPSSPQAFSNLPPLPPKASGPVLPPDIIKGSAIYFLSPWTPPNGIYAQLMPQIEQKVKGGLNPQQIDQWIAGTLIPKYPNQGLTVGGLDALFRVYSHMSPSGQKLMQALVDKVNELQSKKTCTVQAIREWIEKSLLPTASQQFPNLNDYDIETFCKTAQIDIHSFEAPSPNPLQSYIDQITNWEKQFPTGSPQYKFAEAIKNILNSLSNKEPPATLKDAINLIDQQIYTDHDPAYGKRDIYMRYPGQSASSYLTQAQVEQISQILTSGSTKLDVPPFTQMDQKFVDASTWFNPMDKEIATMLQNEIEKLGSGADLNALKQWAQNAIDNHDPTYMNSSRIAQEQFRDITGASIPVDPFQNYINEISNWEKQFPANSPQHQFAEAIKSILKSLEGKTPPATLQDAINLINNQVYQNDNYPRQDIYMMFQGLTPQQVEAISQILTSGSTKLNVPAFTPVDKEFDEAVAWMNQPGISEADRNLAGNLYASILAYGSYDTEGVKNWAQHLIDTKDLLYTSASAAGQAEFRAITGTIVPGSLDAYEKEMAHYLALQEAAYKQFLMDLGLTPETAPTTLAGWEALARRDSREANKLEADIRLAEQTGNWQALQAKWGLAPGNNQTIQKEAEARMNAYRNVMEGAGDQSAVTLFSQVVEEIQHLEATNGTPADLKKWAAGINLNNYPGLSQADIAEFHKLLAA